jgi:cbb3-type cytochrome oxidase maturation protein
MDILVVLIPVSLLLGGIGLAGFFWTMKRQQYDDPDGDAERILRTDFDDRPADDPR